MSAETIDPTKPAPPDPDPKPDSHGEGNGAPTGDTSGTSTVEGHGEGNRPTG